MTVQRIRGVGLCAVTTEVGDWALSVALTCARRHRVTLDIFFFPTSPFEHHAARGRHGETSPLDRHDAIEIERRMRLYYDERLGDYLDVGFRLCQGDEDPELRRCLLVRKESDVLFIPYPAYGCSFGGRPLLQFADSMPCPVVLVGPGGPDQITLNSPAQALFETVLPPGSDWQPLPVSEPAVLEPTV